MHSDIEDIMTLASHVIKRLCDFMSRNSSRKFTIWSILVVIGDSGTDIIILVCHLTLLDHVIKGSFGFMKNSSSK